MTHDARLVESQPVCDACRNEKGWRDCWNCEDVYEHGARAIWDAAIRYERNRLKRLLAIKHLPKRLRKETP